jgi:hypothetical protein
VALRPSTPLFTLDRHETVSEGGTGDDRARLFAAAGHDGGRFIGSVSETRLYQAIVTEPEVKGRPVETIMQPAFPFADVSMEWTR